MITLPPLPIVDHLPEIRGVLASNAPLILDAPPGTGKTTVLPLALLNEQWLGDRRVILLQPRRVAARAAASRMAELSGRPLGSLVGYRIRFEGSVSAETRIEVVTEGLLTRMLQADPALEQVGAILFDEFHERSIHSDLGLLLAREVRETVRPDLRLVVMSATLDAQAIARALPGASKVMLEGRLYPVEIEYRSDCPRPKCAERAAREVQQIVGQDGGDVLVFLPGKSDLERAETELKTRVVDKPDLVVCKLHGELAMNEQVRAILPDPQGRRKVVFATPIAETSLTIEGVTHVIDAGFEKGSSFDAGSGLNRLVTRRISRDAAEQRAGRAGRTQPGRCVRLWSEETHRGLRAARTPEILESDLSGLVLELAVWGKPDPQALEWITAPPESAVRQARDLLVRLGALGHTGEATPFGRELSGVGAHPRLGSMLLHARSHGLLALGSRLAALIDERDLITGSGRTVDVEERLRLLEQEGKVRGADAARVARVRKAADGWQARLARRKAPPPKERGVELESVSTPAAFLLASAYPERIAVRRGPVGLGDVRYLLAQGKGALMRSDDPLTHAEYVVIALLHDAPGDGRMYLAAELDRALFDGPLASLAAMSDLVAWDEQRGAVVAVRRRSCGALVLDEQQLASPPEEQLRAAALAALRAAGGVRALEWSAPAEGLRSRAAAARASGAREIPDMSDEALNAALDELLELEWQKATRRTEWRRIDVLAILEARLGWAARKALDRIAPESILLPNGKPRRVGYATEGAVLSATVQELFGWKATPQIGPGQIPLVLEILSPARRPVQLTADLAGFWKNTYPEVRKELRGRYPKHRWPEDPIG